ncbi:MAG TPA: IS1595 family transposase [Kiritimatiellia bacterium]|nr:IS1595 family transposase [Kiritimatiellia bacterium]HPS05961.1 IS1595 family transposase [Kiritimatiellia bacterium]
MKDSPNPVAGEDYPRTYQQFLSWFADEKDCRSYLLKCRWPHGFECAHCGWLGEPWTTARGYLHCQRCGSETSVTAGTMFDRTRMPLRTWYAAIWFLMSQKDGASALGLQRVLGFGSYQTAWTWLHKMRRAMVRPDRERLSGKVEVDETYVGGFQPGDTPGRGGERRSIVVIAVETHEPKGFGRVRMRRVADASGDSLMPFVSDVVEKGSEILTDGWKGYNRLTRLGYTHKPTAVSSSGDPAHVSMPAVHRVAALLKRWLLGTHQGAVSAKHLDYYLDEYTFRFNRRSARSRGLLFYRLLQQAANTAPVSFCQIVGDDHNG